MKKIDPSNLQNPLKKQLFFLRSRSEMSGRPEWIGIRILKNSWV
jgi:hypothetical protein